MVRVIATLVLFFAGASSAVAESCNRIVSLAPSITEVVYKLGLGANLVGVTTYCKFPPQAERVPKIGGFFDINMERIATLKPTIVIGLAEHEGNVESLKKLGLKLLVVEHRSVDGIKQSVTEIANVCDREPDAIRVLNGLTAREQALTEALKDAPSYKVLVAVGRTRQGSSVSGVYVSGEDGYYTDVLELLGLKNANVSGTVNVPTLSLEGLIALAPDAVLEIAYTDSSESNEQLESFWTGLKGIKLKEDRVLALADDFASIPGPRYIDLAERIAHGFFPDGFRPVALDEPKPKSEDSERR